MAQIKDILDKERQRSAPEQQCVIHLYPDSTFYRAYEWSAWLCCRYLNAFKVTHKSFKNVGQTVAFIGFPQTSLPKFVRCACSRRTGEGGVKAFI